MSSGYVVCWIFLQTFQTYFCIQTNSVDPDQSSLIWVHTVVVISVLRINLYHSGLIHQMTKWCYFFLFFMQIVSNDEMSNPVFWGKKKILYVVFWKFYPELIPCPHSCMAMQKVPCLAPLCTEILAGTLVNILACMTCMLPSYILETIIMH